MKPPPDLRVHLIDLRSKRRQGKRDSVRRPRISLTAAERLQVLAKTSGRCHICGGKVEDERWQADHVIAHSAGGTHEVDNYLPAHSTCNNYRWDYLPEEFQYILKLGVWASTQMIAPESPLTGMCSSMRKIPSSWTTSRAAIAMTSGSA
jgi:5-methylcytosine-specific restriction endonuclease McrA